MRSRAGEPHDPSAQQMPKNGRRTNHVMPGLAPRLSGWILVDEVHGMDSSGF
jgi:hypothetical protein